MKKISLFLFMTAIIACDIIDYDSYYEDFDDQLKPMQSAANKDSIVASLLDAEGWVVSNFIEDQRNKTSLFTTYVFTFRGDGSVLAKNSEGVVTGSFAVFRDDGKIELEMMYPINSRLYELTDDWYFNFKNEETIKFSDSGDILELSRFQ